MKTQWDYTNLADAYLKRPDYAPEAIDKIVKFAGAKPGDRVCDVGAGVAHLTIPLAQRGFRVDAVEPNDAMRANGIKRTAKMSNVAWHEGTGEANGQPDAAFQLVTFGSSFNVTDGQQALRETARVLKKGGWFACLWNHRDLEDPLQAAIEAAIKKQVPDYDYGSRRADQTDIIAQSRLFGSIERFEARVLHQQTIEDCLEAWRSHGTLDRQAKDKFPKVIEAIGRILSETGSDKITVPYTTRVWAAPLA